MDDLYRAERIIVVARWVATAFALIQVTAYELPYPPRILPLALTTAAVLAVGNLGFWLALLRVGETPALRTLSVASLSFDVLIASTIVWLYAFDPTSHLWAVLFVVPIAGAVRFQLAGALGSWAVVAISYILREIWASSAYGTPVLANSISYRMGLLFIVSLIVGLLTRDLARERTTREQALADLARIDSWRSGLVSVLAHDVRSPVGSVETTLLMLDRKPSLLQTDGGRELVKGAMRQTRRVQLLASDLLDLARLERGVLELRREPVRLHDLVQRVIDGFGPDVVFRVDIAPGLELVADPARLEQVLTNLVSNAARHGLPPITVSAEVDDERASLTVADEGSGVPPDDLDALFEQFTRGSRADSTGLGLWICRQLTEAHGGELTYVAGPDGGACFRVTLPQTHG